jgi:DNA-binding NarL/FixJ family response regulator
MYNRAPVEYKVPIDTRSEDIITVAIGDSREAMRAGLTTMLSREENIKVVGEARNGRELLSIIQQMRPDTVILDGKMRGVDSNQIVSEIKKLAKGIGVIVLNDEKNLLIPAIESGVSGFITRDISRGELVTVIRIIHLWHSVLFNNGSHFALVRL